MLELVEGPRRLLSVCSTDRCGSRKRYRVPPDRRGVGAGTGAGYRSSPSETAKHQAVARRHRQSPGLRSGAKAIDETVRGVRVQLDVTASPTITTLAMTQLGVIFGTAHMSPEQAKGCVKISRTCSPRGARRGRTPMRTRHRRDGQRVSIVSLC